MCGPLQIYPIFKGGGQKLLPFPSASIAQQTLPVGHLAALVHLSLAQGLGEGALLEQEDACPGTILDTGISEGKKRP